LIEETHDIVEKVSIKDYDGMVKCKNSFDSVSCEGVQKNQKNEERISKSEAPFLFFIAPGWLDFRIRRFTQKASQSFWQMFYYFITVMKIDTFNAFSSKTYLEISCDCGLPTTINSNERDHYSTWKQTLFPPWQTIFEIW
jgi:hypothetical protein